MKANRGYLAKFLLLLALLLPFIIHYFPDLTFEEQLVPAVVGVPPAGLPGTGSGRIAAPPPPSKSNDKSPAKLNVVPQKKNEEKTTPAKPPEKSPPAGEKKAHLNSTDSPFDQNSLSLLVSVTTLIQTENGNNRLRGSIPGKVLQASLGDISDIVKSTNQDAADKSDVAVKQKGSQSLTRYTGEDAIWAWVRSKLHRSGYKTKLLPINFAEGLAGLYTVNRGYEIVGENNTDWNTHRLVSIGLYYLEPVMRFLYRFFIQFPKIWPFGDIIFPLFMLALAAIAWVFTGPNRRKVKGSVMDIRLAA